MAEKVIREACEVAQEAWKKAEARDEELQITRYDIPALRPIRTERDTVVADLFGCLAFLVLAVVFFVCAGVVALVLR